jgi:hypothetical protein
MGCPVFSRSNLKKPCTKVSSCFDAEFGKSVQVFKDLLDIRYEKPSF